MAIDDTTKWIKRFINDKDDRKRRIYIEDNERFGRIIFALDGYMMAIARADEESASAYHDGKSTGWTNIIPALDTFSTNVTVPTEALVRAIMRADVVARHTQPTRPTRPTRRTRYTPHPVHIVIESRVARVRAEASDIGQIETVIDAELDGSPVTITLDAKRVLTILRGWSSVSNGQRRKSSTLDGADETIIRVGKPDEIIMIQPADIITAGRFAILVPLRKFDDDAGAKPDPEPKPADDAEAKPAPIVELPPADDAEAKPAPIVELPPDADAGPTPDADATPADDATPDADAGAKPGPEPAPIVELQPDADAKPKPDADAGAKPDADAKPKPDAGPTPDRLTIHPKIELTPAKASRIVEHWSAVVEFAQTGTLASENGARLVHYDTCTVLDLGGKRNKYTQWKAGIIAQHEEVIRAYVNENR